MAGLGLLVLGVIMGGNAIKSGIENAQMMSKPYKYLDDGTPVYLDRLCNEYINGEKVVSTWTKRPDGSVKVQQVGQRSGKVYFDPDIAMNNKIETRNREKIMQAKERGRLAYLKYDVIRKKEITCEISTGKYISYLEGRKDGTYWKYYLPTNFTYYSDRDENAGVQITQEEYDKLNIICGSHFAVDLNRYTYNSKCKLVFRSKPLVTKEDLPKIPERN